MHDNYVKYKELHEILLQYSDEKKVPHCTIFTEQTNVLENDVLI